MIYGSPFLLLVAYYMFPFFSKNRKITVIEVPSTVIMEIAKMQNTPRPDVKAHDIDSAYYTWRNVFLNEREGWFRNFAERKMLEAQASMIHNLKGEGNGV